MLDLRRAEACFDDEDSAALSFRSMYLYLEMYMYVCMYVHVLYMYICIYIYLFSIVGV